MPLSPVLYKFPVKKTSLKIQAHALLVHGLGQNSSYWEPLLPGLHQLKIEPHALEMPSLEKKGPKGWVSVILDEMDFIKAPVVLIGHSLGAAACLHAAFQSNPRAAMLLASPFYRTIAPKPPPETGISSAVEAAIAEFIKLPEAYLSPSFPLVHLLGDKDGFISVEQTRDLPYPTQIIPQVKHNFLHHEAARKVILEWLDSCPTL